MDGAISTFESSPMRKARRAAEDELETIVLAKAQLHKRHMVARDLRTELNGARAALRELVREEKAESSSTRSEASFRSVSTVVPLADRIVRQKEAVRRAGLVLTKAEDEVNAADVTLHKLEGLGRHRTIALEETSAQRKATMAAATKYRHTRAQSVAASKAQAAMRQTRNKRTAQAQRTMRQTRASALGEEQSRAAATRLVPQLRTIELAKEKELAFRDEVQLTRAKAAVKLKRSIDAAAAEALGQSRRAKEAAATRKAQLERERERLVAENQNPYRVFREEEERARVVSQRARLVEAQARKRLAIARRMVREGKQLEKHHEVERHHEAQAEKYVRELGRGAREKRVTDYLRKTTRAHTDMLDPTGHAVRIDPSEVTTIKDYTFGMGNMHKTRPDILEMVRARKANAGVSFDPRCVPKIAESDRVAALGEGGDIERISSSGDGDGSGGVTAASIAEGFGQTELERQPGSSLVSALGGVSSGTPVGSSSSRSSSSSSSAQPAAATAAAAQAAVLGEAKSAKFGPFGQQHSTGQLSIFSQKMHAKAREKQRQNIARTNPDDPLAFAQKVCGRTFSGVAFVPEPPEILFADFTPDVPQRKTITLTNVSLSFNQFKVLALPPEMRDRFKVEYTKPLPMAAGKTCKVHVTFTPRSHESFDTSLPLLAPTGPFSIPLRVRAKCCKPSLSASQLSLEDMLVGEMKSRTLTVSNAGALGATFEVVPLRATYVGTDVTVSEEHMAMLAIAPTLGELPPRAATGAPGQSVISVRFAPEADIAITVPLLVRFTVQHDRENWGKKAGSSEGEGGRLGAGSRSGSSTVGGSSAYGAGDSSAGWSNDGGGGGERSLAEGENGGRRRAGSSSDGASVSSSPSAGGRAAAVRRKEVIEFTAIVHCSAEKLPVKVRDNVLDLKCCVAGKLYRTKAVLQNLGKNSFECRVLPPSDLVETAPNVLSFNPELGFVQPPTEDPITGKRKPGQLEIAIKFRPTKNLASLCRRWADIDQPSDVVKIPITVKVRGQPLPAKFLICAQITTNGVVALPSDLDFGVCPVVQEVSAKLVLRNKSALAQRVGFVKLHQGLRIEPAGGFLTLLPHSTAECKVIYAPKGEGKFSFPLHLQCSLGASITIPCRGEATAAPLHFSHTVINMAAAVGGELQTHSFFVSNPIAALGDADGDGEDDAPPRVFEFCIPEPSRSHLKVTPSVATIPPGETLRIEVSFAPPEDTTSDHDDGGVTNAKTTLEEAALSPSGRAQRSDGSHLLGSIVRSKEGETWSRHGHWLVPCYVKPIDEAEVGAIELQQPMFLRINTVQTRTEVGVNHRQIDFGQVSVGQSEDRWLTVKNMLDKGEPRELDFLPLAPAGSFSVLNAPRPLPPGESHKLLVRFSPTTSEKVRETLVVVSGPSHIRVRLRGVGISATLGIELPPSAESGGEAAAEAEETSMVKDVGLSERDIIDLGHTLAGVTIARTFKLHNRSDSDDGRMLRYMVEHDRASEALMSSVRLCDCRTLLLCSCALSLRKAHSPLTFFSLLFPSLSLILSLPLSLGIFFWWPRTAARNIMCSSRRHDPSSAKLDGERSFRAAACAWFKAFFLDVPRPHTNRSRGRRARRADARLELAAAALCNFRSSGVAARRV